MAEEIKGFYERNHGILLKTNVKVGGVWNVVDIARETTLGEEYDNGFAIAKYVDEFPARYATWAILLLEAETTFLKAEEEFNDWIYLTESKIEEEMIADRNNKNIAAGLKKPPTVSQVRAEVKKRYSGTPDSPGTWAVMAKQVADARANRDAIKIVADAFKIKQYTMSSGVGMMKSLIEQRMVDIDKKTRKVVR